MAKSTASAVAKKTVKKEQISSPKIGMVEELFGGDEQLAIFFSAWLENDRNATRAYMQIRPGIEYFSAAVLGHRLLKKVNKDLVLEQYGLNPQRYLQKIDKNLDAKKFDDATGEVIDDQQTQQHYHTKLGKLLDIEKEATTTINILQPIYSLESE